MGILLSCSAQSVLVCEQAHIDQRAAVTTNGPSVAAISPMSLYSWRYGRMSRSYWRKL